MTDKNWAKEYLLDPLTERTPAEETGLHSSEVHPLPSSSGQIPASINHQSTGSSTSTNPFRRSSGAKQPQTHARNFSSSSQGAGISSATGSPKAEPFPSLENGTPPRRAYSQRRVVSDVSKDPKANESGRRRGSSLRERYPGDKSAHPLDMLKHEDKLAYRSPHLQRRYMPGTDSVDFLDDATNLRYHHEGPYDAALLARNQSPKISPLAALNDSNAETLKATPPENIKDSVEKHRPLDGVAIIPPGGRDRYGRVYHYEEGTDMMREPGADYKRWDGIDYLPEDLKGKGEPSYSIELALKKQEERAARRGSGSDIELESLPHDGGEHVDGDLAKASASGSHRLSGEIKRRLGSIRKKDKAPIM